MECISLCACMALFVCFIAAYKSRGPGDEARYHNCIRIPCCMALDGCGKCKHIFRKFSRSQEHTTNSPMTMDNNMISLDQLANMGLGQARPNYLQTIFCDMPLESSIPSILHVKSTYLLVYRAIMHAI